MAQTLARSVEFEGIDVLFEVDPIPDAQGDGGVVPQDGQAKSVTDENCLVDEAKATKKEVDEEAPAN